MARNTCWSVLAALLLVPIGLQAQACRGVPQNSRHALSGGVGFPANATSYSMSGMTTARRGLFVGATVGITSYDIAGVENEQMMGADLAHEIAGLKRTASVCPAVGVQYNVLEGVRMRSVPLGVGVGKTLPLGEGQKSTFTAYAMPQFIWASLSADELDASESDTYFGIGAGATVGVGQLVFGASLGKIFEEGADAVFGIHVGFVF